MQTSDLDRIQIPTNLDIEKMRSDVLGLQLSEFVEYNVIQLTAPAFMVDPSIPQPPPAKNYANGSWTDWLDTPALKCAPYLASIVEGFRLHTDVTLVRLLRLAPGGEVKEHTDPTLGLEIEDSVIRLTIPIIGNDDVEFFLNGSLVPMQEGECWYLRFTNPHRIINKGENERINLSIDMIPNAWVLELLDGQVEFNI